MIDKHKALATVKNGMVALNRATFQDIKLPEMARVVEVRKDMFDLVEQLQKDLEQAAFANAQITPLGDDVKPKRRKK